MLSVDTVESCGNVSGVGRHAWVNYIQPYCLLGLLSERNRSVNCFLKFTECCVSCSEVLRSRLSFFSFGNLIITIRSTRTTPIGGAWWHRSLKSVDDFNWLDSYVPPRQVPVFVQFNGYPPHVNPSYQGRIRLVEQASIEIRDLRLQDQGWYECSVAFLDGTIEESSGNGTWIHLSVNCKCWVLRCVWECFPFCEM